MPGPPTPVSACPLKRLELHNGVKPTLYDSTHPSHALSLTIDRETAAGTGKEALVLLVHCGAQRMVSCAMSRGGLWARLTGLLSIAIHSTH